MDLSPVGSPRFIRSSRVQYNDGAVGSPAGSDSPDRSLVRRLKFSTKNCQTPGRYVQRNKTREPLQVYLRIRPRPNLPGRKKKAKQAAFSTIEEVDAQTVVLHAPEGSQSHRNGEAETRFKFTKVFSETSTQAEVYQVASGIVDSMLKGQSGLIFAYGTTNSGKTYTIQGAPRDAGIMYRAVEQIFSRLEERAEEGREAQMSVWISYLEIYNGRMFDLLSCAPESDPADRPQLRLVANKKGEVYVNGLREVHAESIEQALATITQGKRGRQVAETSLNADSSRSHCVFTIKLVDINGSMWSKLCIVDLAGAERNSRSKAEVLGIRQREANRINTSLMQLGRCLEALRWNQVHPNQKPRVVPYRESKITRLFKDYLEGWGRTVMIATACTMSEDFDETCHALRYTALARDIEFVSKIDSGITSMQVESEPSAESPWTCDCDSKIDELLDTIYGLRCQLVQADSDSAAMEAEIREEVSEQLQEHINEMEHMHAKRLESQEKRLNMMWQRKLQLLQDQILLNKDLNPQARQEVEMHLSNLRIEQANSDMRIKELERMNEEITKQYAYTERALEKERLSNQKSLGLVTELQMQIPELRDQRTDLEEKLQRVSIVHNKELMHATKRINELEEALAQATQSLEESRASVQSGVEALASVEKDFKVKFSVQEERMEKTINTLNRRIVDLQEQNLEERRVREIAIAELQDQNAAKTVTNTHHTKELNALKLQVRKNQREHEHIVKNLETALEEASNRCVQQLKDFDHERALLIAEHAQSVRNLEVQCQKEVLLAEATWKNELLLVQEQLETQIAAQGASEASLRDTLHKQYKRDIKDARVQIRANMQMEVQDLEFDKERLEGERDRMSIVISELRHRVDALLEEISTLRLPQNHTPEFDADGPGAEPLVNETFNDEMFDCDDHVEIALEAAPGQSYSNGFPEERRSMGSSPSPAPKRIVKKGGPRKKATSKSIRKSTRQRKTRDCAEDKENQAVEDSSEDDNCESSKVQEDVRQSDEDGCNDVFGKLMGTSLKRKRPLQCRTYLSSNSKVSRRQLEDDTWSSVLMDPFAATSRVVSSENDNSSQLPEEQSDLRLSAELPPVIGIKEEPRAHPRRTRRKIHYR